VEIIENKLGFLDNIFYKTDPEEVKNNYKGIDYFHQQMEKNVDDLGRPNRLNEFLTDDFTIGFFQLQDFP
jgi:hypothetical protein|tara:strand:+ start:1466 stop:1675 length:210 start_codon:yes stop_codon:yes gene_type:complete